MSTRTHRRSRLVNIVFWSVISAAFVGPGTITTAARAGSGYGLTLLWALVFSTIATIWLQETAARLTICTGKNLGHHIREMFRRNRWIAISIWFSVVFGCAAYEAGNILGAIAGLEVLTGISGKWFALLITFVAFFILLANAIRRIARLLGICVAIMGVAFTALAFSTDVAIGELLRGMLVPRMPEGSLLLVIALVGTTVVPYNLFLGSGMGTGQTLAGMRSGLIGAITLGGVISMAVLVSGTLISGDMTFATFADAITLKAGPVGKYLFGVGLLAAGLTSAVTAPLAAAVATRSVFEGVSEGSVAYKTTWMSVLLTGGVFSLLQFEPVAVIIGAQALNGLLLPVVASSLYFISVVSESTTTAMRTSRIFRALLLIVVVLVIFLGINSFLAASGHVIQQLLSPHFRIWTAVVLTALATSTLVIRTAQFTGNQ